MTKISKATDVQPEPSDGELLFRYLEHQEEEAFAALIRRHGGLVYNCCRRILQDHQESQDVTHKTFLRLLENAHHFDRRASVAGWLYRVAWRQALNVRKARQRRCRREQNAAQLRELNTMESTHQQSFRRELDSAINSLPAEYREPLVLFHLEEVPLRDIARTLQLNINTVGTRLARGRKLLRRALQQRGVTTASVAALTTLLSQETASATPLPESIVRTTLAKAKTLRPTAPGRSHPSVNPRTSPRHGSILKTSAGTSASANTLTMAVVLSGVLVCGGLLFLLQPKASREAVQQPQKSFRTPPSWIFHTAINLYGPAVIHASHHWLSHQDAIRKGLKVQATTYRQTPELMHAELIPSASASEKNILSTAIFSKGMQKNALKIAYPLRNGTYRIYLWIAENKQSYYRKITVIAENRPLARHLGSLPYHAWRRYGPYPVTISDGMLNLTLLGENNTEPHLMGIEIWAPPRQTSMSPSLSTPR